MHKNSLDIYKSELEELTGKVYRGDLTPMVFDLIKESLFKEVLIKELSGEDFIVEMNAETVEFEEVLNFDDWFNSFSRLG